jgi:hypothetical protein
LDCSYSTDVGETRTAALRRQNAELKEELTQLRELFALLHTRTAEDSVEILNRIRSTKDALGVLQSVRQADILLPNPPAKSSRSPRVQKFDAEALAHSTIRVPARPWTTVMGDGIVSELVTGFFQNDHGYLVPFIHQVSFLRDMRSLSPEKASYCSPSLLNAMCALKCVNSSVAHEGGPSRQADCVL